VHALRGHKDILTLLLSKLHRQCMSDREHFRLERAPFLLVEEVQGPNTRTVLSSKCQTSKE
jgi:hypothetical protein